MSATVFADFKNPIASADVDDATLSLLELWLNDYLGMFEDKRGLKRGFLARPKTFASTISEPEFLDHTLPAVFVATARVNGTPEKMATDNSYSVWWLVAISCVLRGPNPAQTRRLASYFESVVRKCLVDHPQLDGSANGVTWLGGGEVRPLPDQSKGGGRYLAEGASQYLVRMDDVVAGGLEPSTFGPDGPTPAQSPDTPPKTTYEELPVPATTVDTGNEQAVSTIGA